MSNARSVETTRNDKFPPLKTSIFITSVIILTALVFPMASPAVRPAEAASDAATWTRVNIPTEGEAGDWVLAAGSDIEHLTAASDGTLYAAVKGLDYTLYRSSDGGYRWEHIGNVREAIIGIATSPYDVNTVYYATTSDVYRSTNRGQTFTALPPYPGDAGTGNKEITAIGVSWSNGNIIAVGTRDTDSHEFGGVYTFDEAEIIPAWTDTHIGNYDVCTLAFSPDYNGSREMLAVVTDENDTFITVKIGSAAWNINSIRLDITARSAEIAFSDNTDVVMTGDITGYVAIATGTGEGDVYKIDGTEAPGTLTVTDLNAGLMFGHNNTDISGLAVYRDGASVTLLAGAADSAMTYISTDDGVTWTRSRKAPTGESHTGVLIAPDFGAGGRMYAFTSGAGSALSMSRDAGATWDQVSLIDTAINTIVDLAPSPRYSQDNTIFMITFGSGPSSEGLWRSLSGGETWERILSGDTDTVDSLRRVALPSEYGEDCQTVFVAGESSGSAAIWQSTDSGQSFRRRFAREPAGTVLNIDTWAIADPTTIYVGSYDGSRGMVYKSVNGGFIFAEGMPAGNQPLQSIALSPDHLQDGTIMVGNTDGRVYLMGNQDSPFKSLPGEALAPPLSVLVEVAFDPAFGKNHTVYAAGDAAGSGIYRFVVGQSAAWESIDGSLPAGATVNGLIVANDGTFYAVNSTAGGGMERSLNPASAAGPTFETIARGLSSGAKLYGLWQAGNRIWSVDTAGTRLMTYHDTLTKTPVLAAPDDGVSAIGNLVDHTVRNISLDWDTMEGATSYEWQCSYYDDFASASAGFGDSTSGSSVRLPALEPATTYYWRVRASRPALSPWSEKRSFTTVMDTEAVTLRPESPAAGATGVALKPVFQWTALVGAEAYELLVATDVGTNNPVISKTGEHALAGNVWQCDISLDYATTYYWKVRAIGGGTSSGWSTTGVFTTESAPEPTATQKPVLDHEVTGLPANLNLTPLAVNPTPVPAAPAPSPNDTTVPELSQWPGISNLVIYLIGGLLAIIALALIVILAIILKIKRVN